MGIFERVDVQSRFEARHNLSSKGGRNMATENRLLKKAAIKPLIGYERLDVKESLKISLRPPRLTMKPWS